jgi:hypothetical protein
VFNSQKQPNVDAYHLDKIMFGMQGPPRKTYTTTLHKGPYTRPPNANSAFGKRPNGSHGQMLRFVNFQHLRKGESSHSLPSYEDGTLQNVLFGHTIHSDASGGAPENLHLVVWCPYTCYQLVSDG